MASRRKIIDDDPQPPKRAAKAFEPYAEVMRAKVEGLPGLSEKAMMGGLCFMLDGNMLCGAHKGGWMFRVGKENQDQALAIPGVQMMVMGDKGRTMSGFMEVRADEPGLADHTAIDGALALALGFVSTLPPK